MRKYLFKKIDKPFKACLHVHTTVSDGNYTPEEIKKLLAKKELSQKLSSFHFSYFFCIRLANSRKIFQRIYTSLTYPQNRILPQFYP